MLNCVEIAAADCSGLASKGHSGQTLSCSSEGSGVVGTEVWMLDKIAGY